ncbi:MAG: pyridoxal-phosphate-dependent aminotransferase family protein [Nocardioides sp.]
MNSRSITINLSPGPVDLPSFSRAGLDHRNFPKWSQQFETLYGSVLSHLRALLGLDEAKPVLLVPGSGTTGQEAIFLNLIKPGERVLVYSNGYYGDRLAVMIERSGGHAALVRLPWETPLDADRIAVGLHDRRHADVRMVCVVHLETSTGVLNPVGDIADAVKAAGRFLVVDAVSSAGSHPLSEYGDQLGVVLTVPNKGLLASPGFCIISLSDEAIEKMGEQAPRSYIVDFDKLVTMSTCQRTVGSTITIDGLRTLDLSLRHLADHADHGDACRGYATALRAELDVAGMEVFGEGLSNTVTCVLVGVGVTARRAADQVGVHVGDGMGELQGRSLRIANYSCETAIEPGEVARRIASLR